MTNHERTAKWLEACGKKPGTRNDLSVQIGVNIEEYCELLECIDISNPLEFSALTAAIDNLRAVSMSVKKGWVTASIPEDKRIDALDAICDSEVSGNGICHLAGFDKVTADEIVLYKNDDKLVDGKPVILPGGKIGKREGWTPPDLRGCV